MQHTMSVVIAGRQDVQFLRCILYLVQAQAVVENDCAMAQGRQQVLVGFASVSL